MSTAVAAATGSTVDMAGWGWFGCEKRPEMRADMERGGGWGFINDPPVCLCVSVCVCVCGVWFLVVVVLVGGERLTHDEAIKI